MYIFAERLIARKQYNRANDYLERAYATAQRLFTDGKITKVEMVKKAFATAEYHDTISNIKCFDGTIRCRGANFTRGCGFCCWSSSPKPLADYAMLMERLRLFDKAKKPVEH